MLDLFSLLFLCLCVGVIFCIAGMINNCMYYKAQKNKEHVNVKVWLNLFS